MFVLRLLAQGKSSHNSIKVAASYIEFSGSIINHFAVGAQLAKDGQDR
jgi:hypothetical protein